MNSKKKPSRPKHLQRSTNAFPVVGVGASAGGLDAFRKLLKSIPENSGVAYVLVQHLDPKHESLLPELLQKVTRVPVLQISDDIKVQPDHIYIIPSNKMLIANNGVLQLSPRPTPGKGNRNLPIDLFFQSLAEVHQDHSIGVVLSGTASDGTVGLRAIKDHGGITFAQDEQTAAYYEMPGNAVRAGVVDFISPPQQIPEKLREVLTSIGANGNDSLLISKKNLDLTTQILVLLRIRKGTDFTYYKQSTIRRRISRRMALKKIKSVAGYLKFLQKNKNEQDLLYNDFLIPVTTFFRDPKTFEAIVKNVFPAIAKNKVKGESIRIWVAGCSTGEEAYSLAICFKELKKKSVERLQIFATDISEPAIAKARIGSYSDNSLKDVSSRQLKEFFTKTDNGYHVNKEIREMCVFAVHDFLKDPPFGKMDLISCRNVLIYMEPYLQRKALSTFHYALGQKGFLLLGKSEASTSTPELFSIHSRHDKIFLRKDGPGRFIPVNGVPMHRAIVGKTTPDVGKKTDTDFQKIAAEIIFNNYTPDGIVVNDALEVVHFHGNNSAYLQLSTGKPSHNLTKLARPGLAFELRSVLHKARKEKKAVSKTDIPLIVKGAKRLVTIEAIPLPNTAEPYYLILFHGSTDSMDSPDPRKKKSSKLQNDKANKRIQQLEQELAQARDDMNSITEDQETVNEELQSANEELQSSSEELQSLNEEIETSKEEVQSTNEELVALNQELGALNEQVTEERDYANGVISTVREPLAVLDKYLIVKSVNKSFYETFKLTEKETVGKCIYDLGGRQWNIPSLRKLFDSNSERVNVVDFEVNDAFGSPVKRHMLLNAREIVREGGREKLILLAIEDITERRKAEEILRNSEERFRQLVKDLPAAVYSCDINGRITFYNNAAIKIWGREPELGKDLWCGSWKMLSPDGSYLPHEVCPMAIAIKERRTITGEEIIIERTDGSRSIVQVYPQPVFNLSGEVTGAINMAIDITAEKEASNKIKQSEEDLRQLAESLEKTVSERTQELQQANELLQTNNNQLLKLNKELESFTYISSHDLQEPLRKIQIFASRILQKDYATLSDQGKGYFNRMSDAAMHMQLLIRDLLSYSHSNVDTHYFENRDLSIIIQKVIDEFHEIIAEKGAKIELASLGEERIIPFQFHQLIANLIANSLKFSIPGIAPQIVIKSEIALGIDLFKDNSGLKSGDLSANASYCHISVSDNGIGFEPIYKDKIFDVFRRLHTDDVYPGTGIGLAIVKRIVENHRGVITVQSELKNGTTFNIYIPHLSNSQN